MSVVVVVSGGLDSTTLLYKMHKERGVTSGVSFNYGQRHTKELDFAANACAMLGVKHHIIDLSGSGLIAALTPEGHGSSLLSASDEEIPDGHYAEENMKSTVVPNRNMMMISIAGAIAVAEGAESVAVGTHGGDHFIYPDCRPEFLYKTGQALFWGNEGFSSFHDQAVTAPYVNSTKGDIAYDALRLLVPLHETWSCYKGGEIHCGTCGTCVERLEAIDWAVKKINAEEAGVLGSVYRDFTKYENTEFWRSVENEEIKMGGE